MDWNGKWNVNFSSSLKVYQNRSRFLVKMFRRTTDHSGHYRPCTSTTRRSLRHFWLIEEITWINIPLERFSKYFVIKGIMVSYLNKGYRVIGRIEKEEEPLCSIWVLWFTFQWSSKKTSSYACEPFNSHEWPRQSFSLQDQYNIKQTSDKDKQNINEGKLFDAIQNSPNLHHKSFMADSKEY